MLKDIISIQEVGHSFESVDDILAVIRTDGSCAIYESFDGKHITYVDGIFSGLGVYSKNEFYLSEGFTSKIVELDSLETIDVPFKVEVILENRIISTEKEERNRYLISRLRGGRIEWKIPLKRGKHIFLGREILINSQYLDDGKINAYNLSKGDVIWNYDTTTLGTWRDYDRNERQTQAAKVLGIHEDKLLILLNSGKVLILNVESGEYITLLFNDKNRKFDGFGLSIELDTEQAKLIQLANQDWIEVNLNTMKVSQNTIEDMKSLKIRNASPIVYDNQYVYFTDYAHYILGAINRSTLKVDWTYTFTRDGKSENEQPRYGKHLKLKDKRLYVLDNLNTLNIFERQD
ncbi:MAG TPA: hypothetical protein PKA00_22685 [Saprospiraceae bacterium]|nr:hypothetical protein [Saprospiraceae bacterium]HMQ85736.1 hypothetical protein [Saprospiraceae bacterium]